MTRRFAPYLLAALAPVAIAFAAYAYESTTLVAADSSPLALFAMMIPVAMCAYVGGWKLGLAGASGAVAASLYVLHPVVGLGYVHWAAVLAAMPALGALRTKRATAKSMPVTAFAQEVVARARRASMLPVSITAS